MTEKPKKPSEPATDDGAERDMERRVGATDGGDSGGGQSDKGGHPDPAEDGKHRGETDE